MDVESLVEQINKEEAKMLDEIFMQELKKEQQKERRLRRLLEKIWCVINMEIDIGMGVDPEIVKEFEGKYVYMRIEGQDKILLALFKKAGSRSALFETPTKKKTFAVLYEQIESISEHNGTINLPAGKAVVVNGVIKNE